jgi:HD domain
VRRVVGVAGERAASSCPPSGARPLKFPERQPNPMPEMLDPGLEHLHRHQRLWRLSTERRRMLRELAFDVLLLVPVSLLFVFAPGGEWGAPWEVALLVALVALASLVRFDIGPGSTSPMHIVQVPLWFVVPPAWLPVMVACALIVGTCIEQIREPTGTPTWTVILSGADAWPAVGPAVVLALSGIGQPTIDDAGVFALAFVAEAAVGTLVAIASAWVNHGVRPGTILGMALWIVGVDAAIAPVGFLGAVVAAERPIAVLALLPLVAVLGEFARERRNRIDQALQLSSAYRGTAQLMGDVLEADDAYTGGEHTQGVVEMAVAVGLELRLEPREMRDLEFGALLHDIGKLRVPNAIINKPEGLDDAEWAVMRQHPIYGQQMLDRVGGALAEAGRIVRAHHERWDGAGYPDGLAGESIPIAARIITACDSLSAMTTNRSYRKGRSYTEAIDELDRCAGGQFDPAVVGALKRVLAKDAAASSAQDAAMPAAARALGLRPI